MREIETAHGCAPGSVHPAIARAPAERGLPPRYRGAYNTTQTVLNRLVDRGLLSRHKVGNSFGYRLLISEEEYLSRAISQILAGASMSARRDALAQLIGELDDGELRAVRDLAQDMRRELGSQ